MPALNIEQSHTLGLPKARLIGQQWMDQAKAQWDMQCECVPGPLEDEIHFKRVGASGTVRISATRFALDAQLGFLLGSFQKQIEAQIRSNLQDLLAHHREQP